MPSVYAEGLVVVVAREKREGDRLGFWRAERRPVGRRMRDDLATERRVPRQNPEVPEHVQLWRRHRCDQADQKVIRLEDERARAVGATPSNLIVQFGKDGKAYLINRDTMGGQSAPLASPTVASGNIINAAVAYKTAIATYALFRGTPSGCPSGSGSMAAVKITRASPPTAGIAWCGGATSKKSAAVSMTDAAGTDTLVWLIGNDNKLRACDGDTGAVVFAGGAAGDTMSAVGDFQTPIVANGRIFAASHTQVYAFKP